MKTTSLSKTPPFFIFGSFKSFFQTIELLLDLSFEWNEQSGAPFSTRKNVQLYPNVGWLVLVEPEVFAFTRVTSDADWVGKVSEADENGRGTTKPKSAPGEPGAEKSTRWLKVEASACACCESSLFFRARCTVLRAWVASLGQGDFAQFTVSFRRFVERCFLCVGEGHKTSQWTSCKGAWCPTYYYWKQAEN